VASLIAAMSLGCALAVPGAPAGPTGFEMTSFAATSPVVTSAAPLDLGDHPMVSRLVLATGSITAPREPSKSKPKKHGKAQEGAPVDENAGLGPERAQILLRSLTLPGWGQATLGLNGSAKVFLVLEAGIWGSYIAFRVQEAQRTDSYLRTARLAAGIDLSQQDDEFRRIVGAFASSDEYNLLVVTRDAANLYLSDPNHQDLASYRAYIEQHSLKGDMSWQWSDEGSFDRYGNQRKSAQKAGLRSNTALALAVANRLVSALHAARAAGRMHAGAPQGWRLDLDPDPTSPGAFRAALSTNF
jgi:hypothetical protein